MTQIKGPDGRVADVDLKNRLSTFAVGQNEDKNSALDGRYWTIYAQVTPTAANDYFFYLKNTGTKNLFITDIRISCSAVSQFLYKHVSGTPVGGAAITPTNRKLADPKLLSATAQQGVDITGLVDLGVLFFEECDVIGEMQTLKTSGNIIIPQGQAVAFQRVAATGAVTFAVSVAESEL